MISRNLLMDIMMIVVFTVLQIFFLSRISFMGKYDPVLYPVFVMFYPFFRDKFHFLVVSFLLGLSIDAFTGLWGINAFSTTLIAFTRTLIFRTSTEITTDFFSFQSLSWKQFIVYIVVSIFLHQFFVQYIEFFKFSRFFEVLLNVVITSALSFLFIIIYVLIFNIKQKI